MRLLACSRLTRTLWHLCYITMWCLSHKSRRHTEINRFCELNSESCWQKKLTKSYLRWKVNRSLSGRSETVWNRAMLKAVDDHMSTWSSKLWKIWSFDGRKDLYVFQTLTERKSWSIGSKCATCTRSVSVSNVECSLLMRVVTQSQLWADILGLRTLKVGVCSETSVRQRSHNKHV